MFGRNGSSEPLDRTLAGQEDRAKRFLRQWWAPETGLVASHQLEMSGDDAAGTSQSTTMASTAQPIETQSPRRFALLCLFEGVSSVSCLIINLPHSHHSYHSLQLSSPSSSRLQL